MIDHGPLPNLSRPFGTRTIPGVPPNAEALGYSRMSLRDKSAALECDRSRGPNPLKIEIPYCRFVQTATPTRRNGVRRSVAAAIFYSLATILYPLIAQGALIPSEPDHVISLDGTWRFKLEQAGGYDSAADHGGKPMPIHAPEKAEPFQEPKYMEGKEWVDLKVPGNWEMAGYSPATYNQPDNAIGLYRLWFEVPAAWKGRPVRLNFDGVQNGAEVFLNGKPVAVDEPSWGRENYHESGWTAFQVDLTPQVKFGAKNLLAVRVTKNTRSANLDSGDYFFLGGIYRPVTLFSIPSSYLPDVTIQTRLLEGDKASIQVSTDLAGSKEAWLTMHIEGTHSAATRGKIENGHAELSEILDHPKLWSAEFPNLYTLNLQLRDVHDEIIETVTKRIGIREVSISNAVFLVNGVPVKLAGVCRHDVCATEGTAVGPDLWRKDITMMKSANINSIRTSHYPYGEGFYNLCDELGIYVVDELPYCWCPTGEADMQPAFEQRARETVRRDKNHPSVIIWTIGNENKAGRNLQVVADLVKKLDPTRPRNVSCMDGEKYKVELSDSHYTSPSDFEKQVARARETGRPHIHLENPNTWDVRLAADPGMYEQWGPVLQRTWEACLKYDSVPGLFPFEWQDRAVVDRNPSKLYYYVPETGINLLKIKGIVDAFRNPRPSLYEVKMVYSPIQIGETLDQITSSIVWFPVTNRYSFTDLSVLYLSWKLMNGGNILASNRFHFRQAPLSAGKGQIALPEEALSRADALQVAFIYPNGNEVVSHRFVLKETPASSRMGSDLPNDLPIPEFNLVTRVTAKKGLWREATRYHARLENIKMDPPSARLLTELKEVDADILVGTNGQPVGKIHASFANGEFSYHLDWSGKRAEVQELGWAFHPPRGCDRFSWDRAARWSVYPPGHLGRARGTATPDSMNVPLTRVDRPDAFDFNSTKCDCNWASLTSESGQGLRIEFDPKQRFHCRAGVSEDKEPGLILFVNQQVSPPDDISKPVVSDLYLTLKPGDTLEGRFRVGSNQVVR
ncbi:MAG: hypothetical protein C5B50_04595 [Verrucomicrobia bacterium]|nr:MAG: hypothetical protein C5B50_04595 [Verrucomicrobiota bacterium]